MAATPLHLMAWEPRPPPQKDQSLRDDPSRQRRLAQCRSAALSHPEPGSTSERERAMDMFEGVDRNTSPLPTSCRPSPPGGPTPAGRGRALPQMGGKLTRA